MAYSWCKALVKKKQDFTPAFEFIMLLKKTKVQFCKSYAEMELLRVYEMRR